MMRTKARADKGLLFISGGLAIPVSDVGNVYVVDINGLAEMVARHPSLPRHAPAVLLIEASLQRNRDLDAL
jgi:hypothetical protein